MTKPSPNPHTIGKRKRKAQLSVLSVGAVLFLATVAVVAAILAVASVISSKSRAEASWSKDSVGTTSETYRSPGEASTDLVAMTSPSEGSEPSSRYRVVYEPVTDAEAGSSSSRTHLRFAAHVVGPDGRKMLLSTRRWAEIVSDAWSDASSVQAADDLTAVLRDSPYGAVYFETRPVSSGTASHKHFHFVVMDAPELKQFCDSSGPDSFAFAEHLRCTPREDTSCAFWNLGGDARLVSPRTLGGSDDKTKYAHLAAFLRGASSEQTRELWRKTAAEYLRVMDDRGSGKTYLSTCGTGVSWLHMRLDERPKYYSYRPFRKEEDSADTGDFI